MAGGRSLCRESPLFLKHAVFGLFGEGPCLAFPVFAAGVAALASTGHLESPHCAALEARVKLRLVEFPGWLEPRAQ